MNYVRVFAAGFYQGDEGMDDSFETFFPRGKATNELDAPPLIKLVRDVAVSGGEENIMSSSGNAGKELLAVFLYSARDVGNSSGACYKDFHGRIKEFVAGKTLSPLIEGEGKRTYQQRQ
jgi:hypothetical protein